MWHITFEDRLAAWNQLRQSVQHLPSEQALAAINEWWFAVPWRPYHLHWDDKLVWPDPWQLLSDNIFCSLARGLGIMYTITLMDRPDIQDASLVDTGNDNLVLVGGGKYILNWDRDDIVNISLDPFKPKHIMAQNELKQQIN